jgi:hypothetical protein
MPAGSLLIQVGTTNLLVDIDERVSEAAYKFEDNLVYAVARLSWLRLHWRFETLRLIVQQRYIYRTRAAAGKQIYRTRAAAGIGSACGKPPARPPGKHADAPAASPAGLRGFAVGSGRVRRRSGAALVIYIYVDGL